MSNTFEEMINELPIRIKKNKKIRCSCGAIHEKMLHYALRIRLDRSYNINGFRPQYYIYYECLDFNVGDSNRYIGESCGIGFRTTTEAIEDLKKHLNKNEGLENDY